MRVGSRRRPDEGHEFTVWAPDRKRVDLCPQGPGADPVPMERGDRGYWHAAVPGLGPEVRYTYRLDGDREFPDPASHHQPAGVHGPSGVVDHAFPWEAQGWIGLPLEELVLYELHVGTFTGEGTFEAAIARLDHLVELGITGVELMPVAQFPGGRNWGYDGVYPFAVQESYGGPRGLKRLVDACHRRGLAVVLDVVYNHLGPEGNYLAQYGPYFTDTYRTPWGQAVNFDGAWSDEVRTYFIQNTLHWLETYRIDALRLDAVHAIYDVSAKPFLAELAETVDEVSARTGRHVHLIAESNRNDVRFVTPREEGGHGLHGEWCDDFHHSLRTVLTGEDTGYYVDFGRVEQFAKAFREGFVYSGQYSAYRKRRHGSSSAGIPGSRFVVFSQNHDQVGNRVLGERLAALVSFEALKLAAGAVLLSPYLPLLFMGEEYGEEAPFLYFVSHGDPDLVEAVREGRKAEFADFHWSGEPPDPQGPETFENSRLRWNLLERGRNRALLALYRELLAQRRNVPALASLDKKCLDVETGEDPRVLVARRWTDDSHALLLMNFEEGEVPLAAPACLAPKRRWRRVLDTGETRWAGSGSSLPLEARPGDVLPVGGLGFALFTEESA